MTPISGMRSPLMPGGIEGGLRAKSAGGFENVLGDAIAKVEQFQRTAGQGIEQFLSGEGEDLHRVVMDTQKAELSMELFSQMRNKVVQAYQEIMRMQM